MSSLIELGLTVLLLRRWGCLERSGAGWRRVLQVLGRHAVGLLPAIITIRLTIAGLLAIRIALTLVLLICSIWRTMMLSVVVHLLMLHVWSSWMRAMNPRTPWRVRRSHVLHVWLILKGWRKLIGTMLLLWHLAKLRTWRIRHRLRIAALRSTKAALAIARAHESAARVTTWSERGTCIAHFTLL